MAKAPTPAAIAAELTVPELPICVFPAGTDYTPWEGHDIFVWPGDDDAARQGDGGARCPLSVKAAADADMR